MNVIILGNGVILSGCSKHPSIGLGLTTELVIQETLERLSVLSAELSLGLPTQSNQKEFLINS